jgi:hypothetical protein
MDETIMDKHRQTFVTGNILKNIFMEINWKNFHKQLQNITPNCLDKSLHVSTNYIIFAILS